MIKVDLAFEGKAKLMERMTKVREVIVRVATEAMDEVERDLARDVRALVKNHTIGAVKAVLGIKTFDAVEKDGDLARALRPHARQLVERVLADRARRPLSQRDTEMIESSFSRGYEESLRSFAYELGKEVAEKHREQTRYDLLGAKDFIEQTENRIVKNG
jgi:hypothetical protein